MTEKLLTEMLKLNTKNYYHNIWAATREKTVLGVSDQV